MRKLRNTLYVTSPDGYLSLEDGNVVLKRDQEEDRRVLLVNLEAIVTFGRKGASSALMSACAERDISLSFMTAYGEFLARVTGPVKGNVILRREQYRIADDPAGSVGIARNFIIGKLHNSKWIIERAIRDHPMQVDADKLRRASAMLGDSMDAAKEAADSGRLRGIEGQAASAYFAVFDELILQQKEAFSFTTRSRRPPLDNVNAMLSFAYRLLEGMCASAFETVGLDPYVGFFHTDRPGRASLALDLMEEFRGVMADRFVLTLVNKRLVNPDGFDHRENGSVRMTDDTRNVFLSEWRKRDTESITHPFLEEKIQWGLAPFAQAQLLARYIRGDVDAYPPFFWK